MPIRSEILGFWWFREQQIGGMAQPGFNRIAPDYRETFTMRENLLRNFIAKLTSPRVPIAGQLATQFFDRIGNR